MKERKKGRRKREERERRRKGKKRKEAIRKEKNEGKKGKKREKGKKEARERDGGYRSECITKTAIRTGQNNRASHPMEKLGYLRPTRFRTLLTHIDPLNK